MTLLYSLGGVKFFAVTTHVGNLSVAIFGLP